MRKNCGYDGYDNRTYDALKQEGYHILVGKRFPSPTVWRYLDVLTTGVIDAKIVFKRNKRSLNFGRIKREFVMLLFQCLLNIFRLWLFDGNTESVIRRNEEKAGFVLLDLSKVTK